jgi:hypothetical protein
MTAILRLLCRASESGAQSAKAIGDSRVIPGELFDFAQSRLRETRDPS